MASDGNTSMIDRVARTILESVSPAPWDMHGPEEQEAYMEAARAAIAAMREPTEDMIHSEYAGGIWRSMIDAALEPVDDDVDRRVK